MCLTQMLSKSAARKRVIQEHRGDSSRQWTTEDWRGCIVGDVLTRVQSKVGTIWTGYFICGRLNLPGDQRQGEFPVCDLANRPQILFTLESKQNFIEMPCG